MTTNEVINCSLMSVTGVFQNTSRVIGDVIYKYEATPHVASLSVCVYCNL
jgi:hypothetical protein